MRQKISEVPFPPLEPLKLLLVGDVGTGKSSFAATFPTPGILFDIDSKPGAYVVEGSDWERLYYNRTKLGWLEFTKELGEVERQLKTENGIKTIVVDSATSLSQLAMEQALSLDPRRNEAGGALWNVHYQLVTNLVSGALNRLMNCSNTVNIVVICHLEAEKNDDGAVIQYKALLPGRLATLFPKDFDEVWLLESKPGKPDKIARTIPKGLKPARSSLAGKLNWLPSEFTNDFNVVKKLYEKAKNSFLQANK